jgi:DNA-binding NtrC family response regulator
LRHGDPSGHGTCISPRTVIESVSSKPATTAPAQTEASPRILFVEDEPNVLELLSLQFREMGYETRSIQNPCEAMKAYKEFNPQAVVLDYKMPYLTGLSVVEQLKKIDPDCRTFLVTAWADREVLSRATRLGVCGCFNKPIDFPGLAKAILAKRKR